MADLWLVHCFNETLHHVNILSRIDPPPFPIPLSPLDFSSLFPSRDGFGCNAKLLSNFCNRQTTVHLCLRVRLDSMPLSYCP